MDVIILLISLMKRKIVEAPVIDKHYLNELYNSIHQQIATLDRLNEQFKSKQEEHFIQSFMNVVEKMGNDLILAQEAYRNIDIEVKRDQYCMELAAELQFFRTSCFQLKTSLEKTEKALSALKIEKENDDTEMASIRLNLEKKIKENMQLKAQNKELARKLRQMMTKEQGFDKRSGSVDQHKYRSFKEKEPKQTGDSAFERIILATQEKKGRRANAHPLKSTDDRVTDSNTPNSEYVHRYDISNLTGLANTQGTSFRRRSYQKNSNRISSELLQS